MALRARVDRHKCIGAGNCITVAPTAFDWLPGDFGKADVVDPESVEEEFLREAAFACPTAAIIIEDVAELLPWQLRGKSTPPRRVLKTFMFTDIVGSTDLIGTIGDEAWKDVVHWHDETLRTVIGSHRGEVVRTTGDGVFASFADADTAFDCAIAIQRRLADHRRRHGFAPQVRIGVHSAEATAIGNILVQAIALGLVSSLEQARELIRRSVALETYEPRSTHEWDVVGHMAQRSWA